MFNLNFLTMSRETSLFINLFVHFIAVSAALFLTYNHINEPDVIIYCVTLILWIGVAGHRNSQLIKTKYAFKEVLEEAMKDTIQIKK